MAGLAAAQLLELPLALWTVLTAVILTQISVGGTLKATLDYVAGTVGGAIYAGAIGALIPHSDEIAVLGGLAIAVGPAALLAATNPRFRAAPFTAVMVFFAPTITHTGPLASAFERVVEVAVGAVVGLIVSVLVLPARARHGGRRSKPHAFAGGEVVARVVRGFHRNVGRNGASSHSGRHWQRARPAEHHRSRDEA
jgi:uncharacterized membrane protein YccC